MEKKNLKFGSILIQSFVFGTISIVIVGALVSWAGTNIKASRQSVYREQALQIAEAGIDYYRWHLAHAPTDYQDGSTTPNGIYVHDFFDKDGEKIGTFSLEITPPPIGFTTVTVKSTGRVLADESVHRSLLVKFAIPSLAKYAVVANDSMRFGEGTEVFGPIHSNGGIRFDGLAHNIISSSLSKYTDPDHTGQQEFGVHTHVVNGVVINSYRPLEAPPNPVQNRPDVFEAGRIFPVPDVDFVGLTTDMAQIKAKAQTDGRYISSSGALGYHIVFNTNDTFDLYRVTQLYSPPNHCNNNGNQSKWGTWSIRTESFVANYSMPTNGLIFVEDNVWVNGQINTARVTVVAGKFPDNPSQRTSITINNNLLYTNYDGQDSIGLIAQENINTGLYSANDLRIDAALISQNGRVGRYYYESDCSSSYVRNSITLYGMLGSYSRYGFAYTDGTGYQTRNIIYDVNLLYGPPPSFPLTSDQYQTVSWEEVK